MRIQVRHRGECNSLSLSLVAHVTSWKESKNWTGRHEITLEDWPRKAIFMGSRVWETCGKPPLLCPTRRILGRLLRSRLPAEISICPDWAMCWSNVSRADTTQQSPKSLFRTKPHTPDLPTQNSTTTTPALECINLVYPDETPFNRTFNYALPYTGEKESWTLFQPASVLGRSSWSNTKTGRV